MRFAPGWKLRWNADEAAWEVPVTPTTGAAAPEILLARRVVLATGIDGSGQWEVPAMIRFVAALDVTPAGKLARADA